MGRDTELRGRITALEAFQSTRPRGARQADSGSLHRRPEVSIHAPAWGATFSRTVHERVLSCFNPRARVGRDEVPQCSRPRRLTVSIHAPAWGATRRSRGMLRRAHVSIHAPAWGATGRGRPDRCRAIVSIHAPAWGATRSVFPGASPAMAFQSTRPRGARPSIGVDVSDLSKFQSTRPRGARRRARSCVRGWHQVSIHAPAWGATVILDNNRDKFLRFNPRARVGRDNVFGVSLCLAYLFQSTRPRGARRASVRYKRRLYQFQSTRPRGARLCQCSLFIRVMTFQSTRPRGARRQRADFQKPPDDSFNPRARVGRDNGDGIVCVDIDVFQSTRPRGARQPHHNSLRDKDFFQGIREPMLPLDPKGTGQVAVTQKTNEINMLLKCEPSRESRTA